MSRESTASIRHGEHDLKAAWRVIMGFSLLMAIKSTWSDAAGLMWLAIGGAGFRPLEEAPPFAYDPSALSVALLFCVFIPTFVRFYVGDSRYLTRRLARLAGGHDCADPCERAAVASQVFAAASLERAAHVVAVEGSRLVGCERLAVLVQTSGRWRLAAISGSDALPVETGNR